MNFVCWRSLKRAQAFLFAVSAAMLLTPSLAASQETIQEQLSGTWSGSWTPEGSVRDAMTIELRYETGKLTGRFVSPASMNFSKAAYDPKTRSIVVEAADAASGKQFKLSAKVEGPEIKGTVTTEKQGGQVHLIKWTYVPRVK